METTASGARHADTSLSADATRSHYDSSTSIVATVAADEDTPHEIWAAGALLPDVDELTIRRFRACSLSGDWRRVRNRSGLELVAASAVPAPGYSVAGRGLPPACPWPWSPPECCDG